ncbi:condensin complex subunit 1-like isoform X2 [Acanthaster planci]|uniref:Condensin complex subunit 1-like isoform X2 n=1 Tax=Acanthaster planci TaxID=133434 RepID=A0A8B7YD18_ACAPL|nr:condensin complex subunit 1-like isoform X2 [Acanthaster planci]
MDIEYTYVFAFIQKDRQAEALVEKLCHRFRATRTDRQPQDLAFCLSLLNMSEKCVRRLQENLACYADKLHDAEVYACFASILSKAKKFSKPETKVMVEDFEQKLAECHDKGVDDAAAADKASKASAAAKARDNGSRSAKKRNTKRRGRGKSSLDSEDEEEEDNQATTTPAPSSRKPSHRGRQTTEQKTQGTAGKGRRVRAVTFSSDEEDSDELFGAGERENKAKDSAFDPAEEKGSSDTENRDPTPTPRGKGKTRKLHNPRGTPKGSPTPLSHQKQVHAT